MSDPFIRYEDGKVSLNGVDLMVKSADLSLAPSLSESRVYGEYDPNIVGARTEFAKFAPV